MQRCSHVPASSHITALTISGTVTCLLHPTSLISPRQMQPHGLSLYPHISLHLCPVLPHSIFLVLPKGTAHDSKPWAHVFVSGASRSPIPWPSVDDNGIFMDQKRPLLLRAPNRANKVVQLTKHVIQFLVHFPLDVWIRTQ